MSIRGFFEIDYETSDIKKIGIGVLGYGFMGKVHSNAYLKIPYTYETPLRIQNSLPFAGVTRKK